MGDKHVGVGDVAKLLGVNPQQITALFYERRLRDDLCPIVSGRRIIPESYLDIIVLELRRKGIRLRDTHMRSSDRGKVIASLSGLEDEREA